MAVTTEEGMLVRVQQENFSIDQELERVRARSHQNRRDLDVLGNSP